MRLWKSNLQHALRKLGDQNNAVEKAVFSEKSVMHNSNLFFILEQRFCLLSYDTQFCMVLSNGRIKELLELLLTNWKAGHPRDVEWLIPQITHCCFKSRTVLHVLSSVYFRKKVELFSNTCERF